MFLLILPKLCTIYLTPEQQSLVADSVHLSLSIARYQASQKPMPSRCLLSCSAQLVLGRPRGRFQPRSGALPQRALNAVQRASWAGTTGGMGATCSKRASFLRRILGSIHYVIKPADSKNASHGTHVVRMWQACKRFTSALSKVRVSAQYRSI